jgi:hypothetical protein
MAETNQPPVSNPIPRQTDANVFPDLISNIQHRRSSQQPYITRQQSVLNQNTNTSNNTENTNSILEGIMGSNQQPLPSPHPTLSPFPDNANQLNDVDANIYLELFQEWQHPTQK